MRPSREGILWLPFSFFQEAFSNLDADDGADEGAGDAVGEPVDVGGDADADVGGYGDGDEFDGSVFSEEHPEREGDREGDGRVAGWPAPENSTV